MRCGGWSRGLRVIEPDLSMRRHPQAVDGTYAKRMIRHASNRCIIGPQVVSADHTVRTVRELVDVRLCGKWCEELVHPNEPSDPFLMTGFEDRCLHITHDRGRTLHVDVQLDYLGDGRFEPYTALATHWTATHVFPRRTCFRRD